MTIRVEITGDTPAEVAAQLAALNAVWNLSAERLPGRRHGNTKGVGEAHPNAAHTDADVLAILARAQEIGVGAAAAEFGVSQTWLSRVRHGHIWAHLTRPAA